MLPVFLLSLYFRRWADFRAWCRRALFRRKRSGVFIRIGARYKHIRKRPRGKPSPQLYAYKCEKLQELENQYTEGIINFYYGDESHVCTGDYVPYGWQFKGEDYYVPSDQKFRLNCFGIIDRNSNYDGFTITEPINSGRIIEYLDHLSFRISKKTVVVLDNAKIHRAQKVICHRALWEKRGLFIFFLPPYSPYLNLAETFWRILKGKWIKQITLAKIICSTLQTEFRLMWERSCM